MATVSKFTRGAVAGNGWTNPANATASDGVYATAAPAKNATVSGSWDWDAFLDSEVPVGSTINAVTLEVKWKVSTTASIATFHYRTSNGGSLGTDQTDATEPTADTISTTTVWASVPTEAQLKTAGQLAATIAAQRGNSTTGVTFSLDYARLTVDFTAPAAAFVGQADGIAAASAGLTTAIPLAATAAGVGAPTGDLTTAIVLAGSVAGAAATTATLTSTVKDTSLAGTIGGTATASAALTTAIALAGSTAGLATATGPLTTAIPLAASAAGSASVVGALTTSIALTAAAVGLAATSASFTTAIRLAAAAAGAAAVSAGLTTAIRPTGAAAGQGTAAGALTTSVRLAATAAGLATASAAFANVGVATLSVAVRFHAVVTLESRHVATVTEVAL